MNLSNKNSTLGSSCRNRGFTLVEMVIVILIASIILAAVLSLAKPYFAERQRQRTVDAVRSVEQGLVDYLEEFNMYPCPAPLNSARGTAADGTAKCVANGTGIFAATGRGGREVLIGAVPYRDLGISIDSTLDAYNNRITYAVSLDSTAGGAGYIDNLNDLSTHTGAIEVNDESGASLLKKDATAHMFFFSHGKNGKGAYTNSGVLVGNGTCTGGVDAENCDNDATFIAALQSHGSASNYYDDFSIYSLESDELWDRAPPP